MPIIDESEIAADASTKSITGPQEIFEADIVPDQSSDPAYKGFWSGINEKYMDRIAAMPDLMSGDFSQNTLRAAGQEAALVGDIIGESVKRLYHFLPDDRQKKIEGIALQIATDKRGLGPTVVKAIQGSREAYDRIAMAHPEAAKDLEAVLNVFSSIGGSTVAKNAATTGVGVIAPLLGEGVNIAKDVTEIAARALPKESSQTINKVIRETMSKAIKMTSKNKSDWQGIEKSFSKANDAVTSIINNKHLFTYVDESGNVVGEGLPKSMDQFVQAISQTKQFLFSQYDALATDAEKKGFSVDLDPISKKLDAIASDPVILKFRPEVAEYAQHRAVDILSGSSTLTPSEAQKGIATLNDGLKPYYANPGYEGAHRIWIDEMIARDMRSGLDDAVARATGENAKYQGLKNLYGSLSTIEPEVSHRAIVFGRQNVKGMPDYVSNPISVASAIRGIMTSNPVALAEAAGVWAAKKATKNANNADRMVSSMFEKVASEMERQKPFSPKSITGRRAMGATPVQSTFTPAP